MARRIDPYRNFRFRLEIDNIPRAGFSEVTIAETITEAVDYRDDASASSIDKLPGLNKHTDVTMKRGVIAREDSLELSKWLNDIRKRRRNVAISIVGESGKGEIGRYIISGARPVKIVAPDLEAEGNEVAIETLELAGEGIERLK